MLKEIEKIKGTLNIKSYNVFTGELKVDKDENNLVVSTGKAYIASRMLSNTTPVINKMAVGIQNTAAVYTEIALGNEIARVELDGDPIQNANSILYIATFPAGTGTGELTEAGLFNSANTMLCRSRFNAFSKLSSDNVIITWTIQIQ